MTFAEENLDAFIYLLNKQPNLFSPESITNLEQLINHTSDDLEKLSTVIAGWYQKHPQIMDAQLALLSQYSSTSARGPGSSTLNPNIPKHQNNKESLLNAIQQSSESTKSDDKQEDKS
ncbi:MAG: hypothetical protein AAF316_14740 [Cyanobacteria bacterium P01_A01_bin.80]